MAKEVVVVLYHHVAETADALTNAIGGATHPALFERHVRYFARNYDLISGDDLIDRVVPRKPLLITFDDAYRSVLDTAGPILKSADAPSLFFINPATVTEGTMPIDNVLSIAVQTLGWEAVLAALDIGARRFAGVPALIAGAAPSMSQEEIGRAKAVLCDLMGAPESEIRRRSNLFLERDDFPALRGLGISVGNHSASHAFLRSLSPEALNREIAQSKASLECLSGGPVRHFSVPYGDEVDATPAVLSVARACGHRAIFLVHARSNRLRPAPDIYYRISLGGTPRGKLPLSLRILPLIRSLRDRAW